MGVARPRRRPPGDEIHQSVAPPSTTTGAARCRTCPRSPAARSAPPSSSRARPARPWPRSTYCGVAGRHHRREPRRVLERRRAARCRSCRRPGPPRAGTRRTRRRGRPSRLGTPSRARSGCSRARLRVRQRPAVAVPGHRLHEVAARRSRCDRRRAARQILPPFAMRRVRRRPAASASRSRTPARSTSGCRRPAASSARPGTAPRDDRSRTAASTSGSGSDRSSPIGRSSPVALPNPNCRRSRLQRLASRPELIDLVTIVEVGAPTVEDGVARDLQRGLRPRSCRGSRWSSCGTRSSCRRVDVLGRTCVVAAEVRDAVLRRGQRDERLERRPGRERHLRRPVERRRARVIAEERRDLALVRPCTNHDGS